MSERCVPHHDYTANILTAGLCVGIVFSYLPQLMRIYQLKSSEGFSPWFLLLGGTSSASAMLNMIVMQWGVIKCCHYLTAGQCIESVAGIFQIALQWFLFVMVLVLYLMYFPPHLKFTEVEVDLHDSRPPQRIKTPVTSNEWRLSVIVSWVVVIHVSLIAFVSFLLVETASPDEIRHARRISVWATFLGVSAALLSAMQYLPQLLYTWRLKLVGALSIRTMAIQSPGSIIMVVSIAIRPGTNWTTWIPYAVAGSLQGVLLVMCCFWRQRQLRLNIDDFGNPLEDADAVSPVAEAIEDAVEADVRSLVDEQGFVDEEAAEDTPLLKHSQSESRGLRGWLNRLSRK